MGGGNSLGFHATMAAVRRMNGDDSLSKLSGPATQVINVYSANNPQFPLHPSSAFGCSQTVGNLAGWGRGVPISAHRVPIVGLNCPGLKKDAVQDLPRGHGPQATI